MVVKIKVDPEKCVGCGSCTIVAEKLFELSSDNKAIPKKEIVDSEEEIELAKEAKEACPAGAIEIIEEE